MRKLFYALPVAGLLGLALLFNPLPPAEAGGMQLKAPRAVAWKDFLGVNAHFLWFEPEAYRKQMQQWQALGLEWTRVDLHWDRHEPQQGQYRLSELDGVIEQLREDRLKSVFYLVGSAPHATSAPTGSPTPDQYPPKDPQLFADTIAMLAHRYTSVDAWQVWNEPNLPSFWRPHEDPEGYARLLLPSTQALRQVAPDKPVVMAGIWL
jgi:beta-xylosidase